MGIGKRMQFTAAMCQGIETRPLSVMLRVLQCLKRTANTFTVILVSSRMLWM